MTFPFDGSGVTVVVKDILHDLMYVKKQQGQPAHALASRTMDPVPWI